MSSLEEPIGLDNMPKLSSVGRLRMFSSEVCRPRADEREMGNCLIEGRQCSSSNSCGEEYTWERRQRDGYSPDPQILRSPYYSRSQRAFNDLCDSWCLNDRHYNSSCNGIEMRGLVNKFLRGGMPRFVKIVEVGPRDGLQNEKNIIPTAVKVELIQRLMSSGLLVVEATSFVSPKWVPQLADAKDVMEAIRTIEGMRFPVLTPNIKGFKAAVAAGAKEIAIFCICFLNLFRCQTSIAALKISLARYRDVALAAKELAIPIRGYVSCAVGCPEEGDVPPSKVAYVAKNLYDMGCSEISLADTIGVGTPGTVIPMLEAVMSVVPPENLAVHFHDTYGQSLSNILVSLQMGISTVDSSVAGLGGCPYAKGASGNVATEDVIYMLNGLGIETNVDLGKIIAAGEFICKHLGSQTRSKAAIALSRITPSCFQDIMYDDTR